MKNKDGKLLLSFAAVGVVIVGIILYMNNLFEGKNLILNSLSQGEVLAGIVIALPTLVTWNQAIEQSQEKYLILISHSIPLIIYYTYQ